MYCMAETGSVAFEADMPAKKKKKVDKTKTSTRKLYSLYIPADWTRFKEASAELAQAMAREKGVRVTAAEAVRVVLQEAFRKYGIEP